MQSTHRIAYTLLAVFALLSANAGSLAGSARAAALGPPSGLATMETPPPLSATATPHPSGQVVKYAGQILDYQGGFVFFTTGDGFRLAPDVKIDDAATGGPTNLVPETRTYARASFDTGNGAVVELSLSRRKLPDDATYDQIKSFAIALSTPQANPDLGHREGYTGLPVQVTFIVEVPPKTPFSDQIYLATDVSGWSATAIRMDRIDSLHYRVTRVFSSGTRLLYRYTRGSWKSSDVGQDGIQMKPRVLLVRNTDVSTQSDTVYGWEDQDPFSPDLGNTLPTPFNPNPFPIGRRGQPGPIGPPPVPLPHK